MSVFADMIMAFFKTSGHSFDAAKDIPPLTGKTILVTGANAGIGKQTALELARHGPAQVWVGARNESSGNEAVSLIKGVAKPHTVVRLLKIDLASFASVKEAAKKLLAESDRLDILVLNAGIMGGTPGVTEDGYEKQFATNHMGHALLLKLLTPRLLQAAQNPVDSIEPRVLMLSSEGHKSGTLPKMGIDFTTLATEQSHLAGVVKYCQSKLANAVYAAPIAKRYPEFTTVAINPGEVSTQLFNKGVDGGGWIVLLLAKIVAPLIAKPVEEGCKNSLWAASAPNVESGIYYSPVGKKGTESSIVKDGKLGEALWEWTESELSRHTTGN